MSLLTNDEDRHTVRTMGVVLLILTGMVGLLSVAAISLS